MSDEPNDPNALPAETPNGPAFRYAFTRDWPRYFAVMEGKGPRDTTAFALDRFAAEGVPDADASEPPVAVDLGCGEGRDAQVLLDRGWRVVGIDGHDQAFEFLRKRPGVLEHPLFDPRCQRFEECSIPRCKLLNASFSLPFCHPDAFDALWKIIQIAIEPGGRFAGQLFGDRDTWASLPDRSHHTRLQAEKLLLGMEIERFEEEEKDSADSEGQDKHWHVFHIVAKQPE